MIRRATGQIRREMSITGSGEKFPVFARLLCVTGNHASDLRMNVVLREQCECFRVLTPEGKEFDAILGIEGHDAPGGEVFRLKIRRNVCGTRASSGREDGQCQTEWTETLHRHTPVVF